jgi:hypothetical protein
MRPSVYEIRLKHAVSWKILLAKKPHPYNGGYEGSHCSIRGHRAPQPLKHEGYAPHAVVNCSRFFWTLMSCTAKSSVLLSKNFHALATFAPLKFSACLVLSCLTVNDANKRIGILDLITEPKLNQVPKMPLRARGHVVYDKLELGRNTISSSTSLKWRVASEVGSLSAVEKLDSMRRHHSFFFLFRSHFIAE